MYILDKDSNQLINAEPTTFKEQKLKERQHLQEWIAKNPEVLGEELLIIQKEFDGFSDTHERLDLLALDKGGKLVVIENKLDAVTARFLIEKVEEMVGDEMYDLFYEDALVQMIFENDFELYFKDISGRAWVEVDSVDDLLKAREISVVR